MHWETVIKFWFDECSYRDWFAKNDTLDATIRERFLRIHQAAAAGKTKPWRKKPLGRLAEILVLDQFSRNMFRNTPEAFTYDVRALELAREAIAVDDDTRLEPAKRQFVYMPFMHSELSNIHAEAVPLFTSLGQDGPLKYELAHKNIIDRFGRYPSRNAVLGRASTPEEELFLKDHPGF